jgi:hypothetical protein
VVARRPNGGEARRRSTLQDCVQRGQRRSAGAQRAGQRVSRDVGRREVDDRRGLLARPPKEVEVGARVDGEHGLFRGRLRREDEKVVGEEVGRRLRQTLQAARVLRVRRIDVGG